jgi:hypothetical protein
MGESVVLATVALDEVELKVEGRPAEFAGRPKL